MATLKVLNAIVAPSNVTSAAFKVRKAATRNEVSAASSLPNYLVSLLFDFHIIVLFTGSARTIAGDLPRAGFPAIGPNAVAYVIASVTGHA
jgi:hypothetical protein